MVRADGLAGLPEAHLEFRYFGGLTLEETAEALNVSLATVKRELRAARAWLAVSWGVMPEAGRPRRRFQRRVPLHTPA